MHRAFGIVFGAPSAKRMANARVIITVDAKGGMPHGNIARGNLGSHSVPVNIPFPSCFLLVSELVRAEPCAIDMGTFMEENHVFNCEQKVAIFELGLRRHLLCSICMPIRDNSSSKQS